MADQESTVSSRRDALRLLAVAGAASTVFSRALGALAAGATKPTEEMIRQAEWIAGISLDDDKRKLMLEGLAKDLEGYEALRAIPLDNAVPPALRFDPTPGAPPVKEAGDGVAGWTPTSGGRRPSSDAELAFAPISVLAGLVRDKQVSSVELTTIYLDRLERYDPKLLCVVSRTADLAMRQAREADRRLARGEWLGPLHGIPWGAKDLLAVPGYPTTWGSVPYKDQVRPETASVAARLERAGAVLVAKTTVGELAWGDVWFGGKTRNPWKPDQGSSGSSAGSASATAAGLVGFAIGTETWGSIVSPSTRCGTTGLRPTFGRVSRHGAMALSWSMDKIGPIARSVEDCALVFAAVHGADPSDASSVTRPFAWPVRRDLKSIRVGYVKSLFEADYTTWADEDEDKRGYEEWKAFDAATLETLAKIGVRLVPVELPAAPPVRPLATILTAEAATVFDELTRTGRDAAMVRQVADAWPNVFRQGQLIPAVEYLRANRFRTLLMRAMEDALRGVDVYVVPSYGGDNLLATNLTGHPAVVLPNGFRQSDGTPTSITFQGRLHADDLVLAVAHAYQQATGFHLRHPEGFNGR